METLASDFRVLVSRCLLFLTLLLPWMAASGTSPVTAQGEEFFRDGNPVRFWGVNVNLQPWHTSESIDDMASRIKDVGFNAVRLWPNHSTFYGSNMARDVSPPAQGFAFQTYSQGDNSQLDKFDRFVARAQENGLSVYMTSLMFYPPIYTEYVDIITTSPSDRNDWIESMDVGAERWNDWNYDIWWVLHYLDERLQEIWLEHASLFLDHVNPYTGLRYADDNNMVMWQLHNESKFVNNFMLNNQYRYFKTDNNGKIIENKKLFPAYFQDKLRERYNAYLLNKYGNNKLIKEAWGGLNNGESVRAGTIDAGAKDAQNQPYGRQRVKDFTEFVLQLVDDWNNRFMNHVRSKANSPDQGIAVSPIAVDTYGWASPAHYANEYVGSMIAFGNYPITQTTNTNEPQYPWFPKLYKTGAWSPFSLTRPADKPAVIYETNYNDFTPFDADLPWLLATFGSWQNINGVFFYFWNAPLQSELIDESGYPVNPYGNNVFANRNKEIWGDETLTAAIQSAGDSYLRRLLPTATSPTVITYDDDIVSDPDWRNWKYEGTSELSLQGGVTAAQAANLANIIAGTAFNYGQRTKVADISPYDISVSGPLKNTVFGADYDFSADVHWRGSIGQLEIDLPRIKAFVGYLGTGQTGVSWSDGFSVNNIALDPADPAVESLLRPFATISLISLDDQHLKTSDATRLSLIGQSYDEGMVFDENKVVSGSGPAVVRRVSAEVAVPYVESRQTNFRNFKLDTIADVSVTSVIENTDTQPVLDPATYDVLITNPNLVTHYTMDEAYSGVTPNEVDNGSDGAVYGPILAGGKIRGALVFDGYDDYVDPGSNLETYYTGDFSVSVWFNPAESTARHFLIGNVKLGSGMLNRGWQMLYSNYGDSKPRIIFSDGSGTRKEVIGPVIEATEGWQHFVMVRQADTVKMYLNGSYIDEVVAIGHVQDAGYKTLIGKGNHLINTFSFNGIMDDVRLYRSAIDMAKILNLHSGGAE